MLCYIRDIFYSEAYISLTEGEGVCDQKVAQNVTLNWGRLGQPKFQSCTTKFLGEFWKALKW